MGRKKQVIDPEGPEAKLLGKIYGASGAMCLILVDGARAKEWPGYAGEDDGRNRTLLREYEEVEAGLECFAGGAGMTEVWQLDDGIALSEFYPDAEQDEDDEDFRRARGLRVAQVKPKGKGKREGAVVVENGCLAAMLNYADVGALDNKCLKKGAKKLTAFGEHGVLIPLESARYDVITEDFGSGGYEDELGLMQQRVRIVRSKAPKKGTTKKRKARAKREQPIAIGYEDEPVNFTFPVAESWGSMEGIEPFEFVALDGRDVPKYDGDGHWDQAVNIIEKKGGGVIAIGDAAGVVGKLGGGLAVAFFKLQRGFGMLDFDHDPKKLDLKGKAGREALGAYFAQLPSVKSKKLGTLTVRSGSATVMRTYAHRKRELKPKKNGRPNIIRQGGGKTEMGAAFPLTNGTYEIFRDVLGTEQNGVLTEIGRLHIRLRILKSPTTAKAPSRKGGKTSKRKSPRTSKKKITKAATKRNVNASRSKTTYLEYSDAKSNKFWEAKVSGSELTVRFGRIGAEGQTKTKQFPSRDKAKAEHDKLVQAKLNKGYRY